MTRKSVLEFTAYMGVLAMGAVVCLMAWVMGAKDGA